MRTFVIQFVVSAAAGLVGVRIAAWLDQRYRRPGVSFDSNAVASFPRSVMLGNGAMALITAWVAILAAVLSVMVWPKTMALFVVLLGLFFSCVALYTTAALRVRCPKCDRRVFDQPSQPPYPEEFGGLSGFGATALRIVVRREVRCVHCGQRFIVSSRRAAGTA